MVTLRARAELAPVDVDAARDTLALVLERLRALRFADGGVVHPASGVVHAGLRDLSGTHPQPGTKYRLSVPKAGGGRDDAIIAVVGDDDRHLVVDVDGDGFDAEVTVANPARPSAVDVTARVRTATGHRFLDGRLSSDAAIDLDRLPGDPEHPPINIRLSHRRIRGHARVAVTVRASRRWQLDLVVKARGRGLLRPLVALAGVALRARFERELQAQFAEATRSFDAEMTALAQRGDGPASFADELVGNLVAAVPVSLAEPVR